MNVRRQTNKATVMAPQVQQRGRGSIQTRHESAARCMVGTLSLLLSQNLLLFEMSMLLMRFHVHVFESRGSVEQHALQQRCWMRRRGWALGSLRCVCVCVCVCMCVCVRVRACTHTRTHECVCRSD